MKPYLELTVSGQFRRLREAALEACRQFGIEVVSLKPLNHGENTTFRALDKLGERHVIRIHRPGYQTFNSNRYAARRFCFHSGPAAEGKIDSHFFHSLRQQTPERTAKKRHLQQFQLSLYRDLRFRLAPSFA